MDQSKIGDRCLLAAGRTRRAWERCNLGNYEHHPRGICKQAFGSACQRRSHGLRRGLFSRGRSTRRRPGPVCGPVPWAHPRAWRNINPRSGDRRLALCRRDRPHRSGAGLPISVSSFPLITLLLGALLLGERLTWPILAGAALIVGGILLLVLRSPIPPEDVPVPGSEGLESLAEDEKPPPPKAPLTTTQMLSGLGLVLAAAVAWSASTLWLRVITVGVPALAVTAIRVPCGALFLVVTLGIRRQLSLRGIPRRALLLLCAAGVFGTGFGSMLYIIAVQRTSAGIAALLVSTSPLWVLPLAAIFLHERITGRVLAGAALTVGGIWLVLI